MDQEAVQSPVFCGKCSAALSCLTSLQRNVSLLSNTRVHCVEAAFKSNETQNLALSSSRPDVGVRVLWKCERRARGSERNVHGPVLR